MKICKRCSTLKEAEHFYKRSASKDGLTPLCKLCHVVDCKQRASKNPDAAAARARQWYVNNPERAKKARQSYRVANAEDVRQYKARWRNDNRGKVRNYQARRRATKLGAIPIFRVDEELNSFALEEMYNLSRLRTALTGVRWHVDHIVPLQSDLVCGLHWYANLRVITAKENQMKSNTTWEYKW